MISKLNPWIILGLDGERINENPSQHDWFPGQGFSRETSTSWVGEQEPHQAGQDTTDSLLFCNNLNKATQVVAHSSQMIYTRMVGDAAEDEKEEGGVVVSNIIINLLSHASSWSLPSYRLRRKARARRTRQKLKLRPRLRRRRKPNLHVSFCLGGLVRPLGCLCIRRIPCQHILFQKWASSNEG